MKTTKQFLGEQLRRLREHAGMTIPELADKMHTSRAQISEVEEGSKNFTAKYYDKLVKACNATPETAFAGIATSDIPREFQGLFWMLKFIVSGGNEGENGRLITGIEVMLEAAQEKAKRSRASPRPDFREEGGKADGLGRKRKAKQSA